MLSVRFLAVAEWVNSAHVKTCWRLGSPFPRRHFLPSSLADPVRPLVVFVQVQHAPSFSVALGPVCLHPLSSSGVSFTVSLMIHPSSPHLTPQLSCSPGIQLLHPHVLTLAVIRHPCLSLQTNFEANQQRSLPSTGFNSIMPSIFEL